MAPILLSIQAQGEFMRLSTFVWAGLATLAIATVAGCGNTTNEIYPNPSAIGGDSDAKDLSAGEPVVIVPSGEDDGTSAKIQELEAKLEELKQQIEKDEAVPAETVPEESVPPVNEPAIDQDPVKPEVLEAAKDSRAEANPPQKTYSVADSVAYSPFFSHKPGELCGDRIWGANKECDDGNLQPGDGCFNCRAEPGWQCDGGSDFTPCWRVGSDQ